MYDACDHSKGLKALESFFFLIPDKPQITCFATQVWLSTNDQEHRNKRFFVCTSFLCKLKYCIVQKETLTCILFCQMTELLPIQSCSISPPYDPHTWSVRSGVLQQFTQITLTTKYEVDVKPATHLLQFVCIYCGLYYIMYTGCLQFFRNSNL